MDTITAVCPECNAQITGDTQARANRNLGIHRRSKHGYISPKYKQHYAERVRRKLRDQGVLPAKSPATPAQLAAVAKARQSRWPKTLEERRKHQLEYGAKYRAQKKAERAIYAEKYRERKRAEKAKAQVVQNGMTASTAVQCKLSECPVCGARFYVAKGQQS
jgi:hypothetical protein